MGLGLGSRTPYLRVAHAIPYVGVGGGGAWAARLTDAIPLGFRVRG